MLKCSVECINFKCMSFQGIHLHAVSISEFIFLNKLGSGTKNGCQIMFFEMSKNGHF